MRGLALDAIGGSGASWRGWRGVRRHQVISIRGSATRSLKRKIRSRTKLTTSPMMTSTAASAAP